MENSNCAAKSIYVEVPEAAKAFNDRAQAGMLDGDVMVILETSSRDTFIGRLVEVEPEYLSFDYVVIENTLENDIDTPVEVRLKTFACSDYSGESVPCRVLSDSWTQDGSFFYLPIRRCRLKMLGPLWLGAKLSVQPS